MASLKNRLLAIAALGMGAALAGCTGMGDYGYGGAGYAAGYGGPSYDTGYYGTGLGGWYNDFYYPGTGIYVFDRGDRRSRWNDGQRRYWQYQTNQRRPDYGRLAGSAPPRWNGGRPGGRTGHLGQEWNDGRPNGHRGRSDLGRPQGDRPGAAPWRGGGTGAGMARRGPDVGGRSWSGRRPGGGQRGGGDAPRPQQ